MTKYAMENGIIFKDGKPMTTDEIFVDLLTASIDRRRLAECRRAYDRLVKEMQKSKRRR
jgi:hypothetical protein